MIKLIFHDRKKSCVGNKKLRDWTKWFIAINGAFTTWFSFSVNKKQKNYKAKFSIKLILKKKTNKDNFRRKKTHEKKRCSNWQCFVRKTTVLSPIKSTKII